MKLRRTFHKVFDELDTAARSKGIRLQFRLYGSRRATYEKFREAIEAESAADVYHVLLGDSENPVPRGNPLAEPGRCWEHVASRPDGRWERPAGAEDEQCQL